MHHSCWNRRDVLKLGITAATAPLAFCSEPQPTQQAAPWFKSALMGLEVGPTGAQFGSHPSETGYASRFDGREIVRATHDCGAEYLVIWARDGEWTYYDSKVQPKAPGLANRDVLQESVGEGHRLGLPIIAYCQLQYPGQTLREHPEWRMVDGEGNPIDGRVCYRSGYVEFMKRMLDEQLAYGIDGFHLDMVDQGFGPPYGCWCANCQKQFEGQYARPMPKGVTWDEDWGRMLEFRYASSEQFERTLTAHIREVNPKATVDFNYHGNPPFSWEVGQRPVQHAGNGDFVTGETGVWGFSALTVGLNAEFLRASTPGRPYQVAMQRGVRMYHDQTTRPLNDLRWELLTLLSHGAFVTIVDKTGYDGWLDPVAYERFGAAFRETQAKRGHFGHQPIQEVGIYYSSRTRDWCGREEPARHFQAFQGAHKAVVYEHIPWGVVLDENVDLSTLKRFPVVMLPNAAVLSEPETDLFQRHVEQGGNLILTGLTGTCDWYGQPLKNSILADLIGARFVRQLDSSDNWIRFNSAGASDTVRQLTPGGRLDWPFLVRGPAVVYEPMTAKSFGELLKPHRTHLHSENRYNQDWPLSADAPVGPAVLLNEFGKGKVLTFAGSPDTATGGDHHIVETRKLLAAAIHLLNPQPRVRIEAPTTIQTVITDDPVDRKVRIHLLGYNAPPQTTPAKDRPYVLPVPIEDRPMYRVKISFRDRPINVRAVGESTRLDWHDLTAEAVVEDVHEILVAGYY